MSALYPTAIIAGYRSETVAIRGVRLHYWVGGDLLGRPVLLWHGFLSTGYAWHKVAPALAEAGLAVLIPDMRGFGDSDKPAGTDGYDNRALAEEFRSLVREIGFGDGKPLILAGHDMGAPPALLWAADHPDQVAGLLYIEGPVMLSEVLRGSLPTRRRPWLKGLCGGGFCRLRRASPSGSSSATNAHSLPGFMRVRPRIPPRSRRHP